MKNTPRRFQTLILLAIGVMTARLASGQTETWAVGGVDENWSTPGNWSANVVPNATTNVVFTNNVGAPGTALTVDNIVDAGFSGTVLSLAFANTNTSGGAGFYHTTQIGGGQTLTVLGNLVVGNTPDFANSQVSAAFVGAGTLVISNPVAGLNVSQGDTGNGASATLNMTNLNTFNATFGGITVGVYNTPNLSVARQKGFLFLAKTNVISMIGNAPRGMGNESQIEVGENLGNGSNLQVPLYLGIMNTLNVNTITIGGDKQGSGALLAFNPVFTNLSPTLVLRGTNGTSSRVASWKVGDNSNQTTTGSGCAGTVDLSNGLIDTMVDNLIIGEGESGASSGTGNGTGTFTFNSGTNNVNTVYLGYRIATGGSSAPTGTMNVNGAATLIANDAICLSFLNAGSAYASGTLNINGGVVLAATITNGVAAAANTAANINVNGGTLAVTSLTGVIGTPGAPVINLTLNNALLQLQVSGFQTNIDTVNFNPAGTTNFVSFSYLPPVASYPVTFPLITFQNNLAGAFNLGVSNFPAASTAYQGYITNDNNNVYLVLTAGPTIGSSVDIWSGQNGSAWDFISANWTASAASTTFANGAPVQFDDSATGPTAISLAASLLPASVTVSNNTLDYGFGGTGKISGSGSLVKYGTASLFVTNSGPNDFLGDITINAGTVQFGNGGTNGVLPASGHVTDNGTLVFNRSGTVAVLNVISGAGALIKNGTSVLTVSGSNDFSGLAGVNSGTLLLNGVLSGTLTNAAGTVIGGSGTNSGAVSVGGVLQPSASSAAPATFTVGGPLTLPAGGSLAFGLNGADATPGNGVNDFLLVGGDLNANNNTISAIFQGVPQPGFTYTLVQFGGVQNGSFNPTVAGTHFGATLTQGSSPIMLTLGGSGANLKWDSITNNVWNVGGASNWLNAAGSAPDVFYQGDSVVMDDSVAGVTNILAIASGVTVSPTVISNNSSTVNYSITGPGHIGGNVSIIKQGNSTLTISSADVNYTGTAVVSGGTLRVGTGSAFGDTGSVVATNGGTLDLNGAGLNEVSVTVEGAGVGGNGAIINSGGDQIHALNIVKLAGDAVFGGGGRWDIRANGAINASLATSDGLTHNLVKKGTNLVALVTCAIDQNIGDIDIQGGSFALQLSGTSQNSGGWFGDTTHSISVENGAEFGVNTLGSAFPLYRNINLNDGSLLTSSAGDNALSGNVTLQGNATVQVTGGASPWLLMNGPIGGSGNLIVSGTLPLTLTASNTFTGNTLIKSGTVKLTAGISGDGSISTTPSIVISAHATLDASQRSDQTMTVAAGQTLQGDGAVNGTLAVGPGATISAGTNSTAPGLLTVSNALTLQGNALMKLNPATGTNDVINVVNGNTITLGGTLTLMNVSASPFAGGNSFQLFNAAAYSGSFTNIVPATPGTGLAWDTNNLPNGVLAVISVAVPQPVITSVSLSGTNIIINGSNGLAGEQYHILTSTNVALPLSSWTVLPAGTFSGATFSLTNGIDLNAPRGFYIIRVP
jgi:autotransporter-associated beta strand protein